MSEAIRMEVTKDIINMWQIFGMLIFLFGVVGSWYVGKEWYVSLLLLAGAIIYLICFLISVRNWYLKRKKKNELFYSELFGGNK